MWTSVSRLGNGLDLKLGTFTEILGYEVYETGITPITPGLTAMKLSRRR